MRELQAWSRVACLVGLVSFVACSGSTPSTPSPTPPSSGGISTTAKGYLDSLLGIAQTNSINRYSIDWNAFRQAVYQAAGNAQTIPDTYAAVSVALGLLGDHHSYFVKPDGTYIYNPDPLPPCTDPIVATPAVPSTIGYVRVPAFSGTDSEKVAFAVSLQNQIRAQDGQTLQGWIVDLRGNSGGTMWPMIAGVGPILGEGTAGAFVDPNDKVTLWGYAGGASRSGGVPVTQVPAPYQLVRANPRVAVLIDCRVASSGEATALSFVGRPNTRFIGTPTRGLSTSNGGYALSDGATLILTNAFMADRNLVRYGRPVAPDETTSDADQVVQRAIEWLRSGQSGAF